jgi:hypothetical protein
MHFWHIAIVAAFVPPQPIAGLYQDRALAFSGDTLLLERYGEQIRFIRSTP